MDIRIISVSEESPRPKRIDYPNVRMVGSPGSLAIYARSQALCRIFDFLRRDTTVERGGVLLGNVYQDADRRYIEISDYIAAEHTEESGVHMKFTIATWSRIEAELESRHPSREKVVVGWVHSHPNLGVFVSANDVQVHKIFSSWYHCALVVDPVRRALGFFHVHPASRELGPTGGFYIVLDSEQDLDEFRARFAPAPEKVTPPIRTEERPPFSGLKMAFAGIGILAVGVLLGSWLERGAEQSIVMDQVRKHQELIAHAERDLSEAIQAQREWHEKAGRIDPFLAEVLRRERVHALTAAGDYLKLVPLRILPAMGRACRGRAASELEGVTILARHVAPGRTKVRPSSSDRK